MPVIRCDSHGLTYATECCAHIDDAVDAGRFERAHVELNGWAEQITVCDACRDQTHAQREAHRAAGTKGWFFELAPPQRYPCGEHIDEWHAASGQGDRIAAIRRARTAVGIEDVCEVHGEVQTAACCVHIAAAVKDGRSETAHVELDAWGNPTVVCDRCLVQTRARRKAAEGVGMWRFELEPPARYPCGEHVKEWLLATGQRGLADDRNDR
jgi:hypothetical protein